MVSVRQLVCRASWSRRFSALLRVRHKPKMTVVLTKSARFDETIMAEGAHGSYANDDEDTYEDADYSDAAFRDPRVPDVGEGDIAQARLTQHARPMHVALSGILSTSSMHLRLAITILSLVGQSCVLL